MNVSRAARWGLWALVYSFLISYLHPELIWKDIPVTGGDMASHYDGLVYFVQELLPRGKILGWNPGNYAGFPLYQMYFPLPFILMAVLSLAMPLVVAFKLVCLAGIMGMPLAVASMIRNLGFERPAPELAAVFTLPFLFNQANSAWGGNILSVMSGEFSYSIGLALGVIYLGRIFRDIDQHRRVVGNAALLAFVGLFHGYPLLFCVLGVAFFLLTDKNWIGRLAYILEVNLLAFCFMGFWIVPLLLFAPYTTPLNFVWIIKNWGEVFPMILLPFMALGVWGILWVLLKSPKESPYRSGFWFLFYLFLVALVFYFIAFKIGVVDVRFLPLGQLMLVAAGAGFVSFALKRLEARSLGALALAFSVVIWTGGWEKVVGNWVEWNFSGWENKPLWSAFKRTTDYLKGDFSDPRVVYEHCGACNAVGTIRAFECLPLFSGRATLEGAYIQACLSAPAVFYIQSLVSRDISAPLTQYNYGRFDLDHAAPLLGLYNVSHYITVTEESRAAALKSRLYRFEKSYPPFAVFHVESCRGRYVVQPSYRPVMAVSRQPKEDSFAWMRWANLEVPLVFGDRPPDRDRRLFSAIYQPGEINWTTWGAMPEERLSPGPPIKETVLPEEIIIEGATPGRPLLIKVTYHPNWKVHGAARVWRAAPSLMLIYPEKERVRLNFGMTFPNFLGIFLTVWAAGYTYWRLVLRKKKAPLLHSGLLKLTAPLAGPAARWSRWILTGTMVLLVGTVLYIMLFLSYEDPVVYHRRGLKYYDAQKYDQAGAVFSKALERFPLSPVVDRTLHHLALCYFNQKQYDQAEAVWSIFESDYPESRLLPDALYHMGLCAQHANRIQAAIQYWEDLVAFFPDSIWSEPALDQINDAGRDLDVKKDNEP